MGWYGIFGTSLAGLDFEIKSNRCYITDHSRGIDVIIEYSYQYSKLVCFWTFFSECFQRL